MNKSGVIVFLLIILSSNVYCRTANSLIPLYLKERQGELVMNNNLLVGDEETYFSDRFKEITFEYKAWSKVELDGPIYYDLRVETPVNNFRMNAYPSIKNSDGEVVQLMDCLSSKAIKKAKDVIRINFKSCNLAQKILPGEVLYLTFYVDNLEDRETGESFIMLHSPRNPSKVLLSMAK